MKGLNWKGLRVKKNLESKTVIHMQYLTTSSESLGAVLKTVRIWPFCEPNQIL